LLYHCNFGPPLLSPESRVAIPISQLWPMTQWAATNIDRWSGYGPPISGFEEQVYCMSPLADHHGISLAVLHNKSAGIVLRWPIASLPCFTVWKNTAAVEDGYVTGLEPATSFPRFKSLERQAGRVVILPPAGTWNATWTIEVTKELDDINSWLNEVIERQSKCEPLIHRVPLAD
jgi:hypothetical protein